MLSPHTQNHQQTTDKHHHRELQEIWASLCSTPRIEMLRKVFDCLSDNGPQKKHLMEVFDTAFGLYPEPVMSVGIFLLLETIRRSPTQVKGFFQSMWRVLGQLVRDKPYLYLHSRRQQNQEVTSFYDHIYGLYVIRKLASQPITFADILTITNVLTERDNVSRAFQDWVQGSGVIKTWSTAHGFAQLVVWTLCSKILVHSQPTAHPLVTFMLEIERWGAEQYIKLLLARNGADSNLVHLPFGNAIMADRQEDEVPNVIHETVDTESSMTDERDSAMEVEKGNQEKGAGVEHRKEDSHGSGFLLPQGMVDPFTDGVIDSSGDRDRKLGRDSDLVIQEDVPDGGLPRDPRISELL